MVDFNVRLGKAKSADSIDLNSLKAGLSANDVTNTGNKSIFSGNTADNKRLAEDYNNIFKALDTDGKTAGVLEESEISSLKDKIHEYSKNEVFSKREAGKLLDSLGLKNVKAETFFGFLKDVVGISEKIETAETDDNGNTTVKYAPTNDEQRTVKKNAKGDVMQTKTENIQNKTFIIQDGTGKIIQGKDSIGNYTRTELGNSSYRITRGEVYTDYTDKNDQQVEIGGKDKEGEYKKIQLENGDYRIQRGDKYKDFSIDNGKPIEIGGKDKDGEYTRTELDNGYMLTRKNPASLREATTETTYDDKGNALIETYKDVKGSVTSSIERTYNDKGKELTHIEKDAKGNITWNYEYTYDDKGKELTYIAKDAKGNITWIYEYTYDDKGNQLTQTEKDDKGKVIGSSEYTYDDKGNPLTETWKDDKGKVIGSSEYTYDDKGNPLTETWKDDKGKVTGSREYTYDDKGNKLTNIRKDAKGNIIESFETTYDDKGNRLTTTYNYTNNETEIWDDNISTFIKVTDKNDIKTSAKNGEKFDATMERLGITEDADKEIFRKANKEAEARGWFLVGELDVNIPKELAEKLDLFNHPEKIALDVDQEIDNYKWQQEQKNKKQ